MLQELAARIGMVSGADLAHTVRENYPRWLTYTVYANLELAIMGADLQACTHRNALGSLLHHYS